MLEKCNFCMSDVASALVNAQNKWKTWQILIETSRGMARERAPKKNTINYSHSHSHYSPHCPPPPPPKKSRFHFGTPAQNHGQRGVDLQHQVTFLRVPLAKQLQVLPRRKPPQFHLQTTWRASPPWPQRSVIRMKFMLWSAWSILYTKTSVVPRLADPWLPGSCWGIPRLKIFS